MFESIPGIGIPYIGVVIAVPLILVVIAIQIMVATRVKKKFYANYDNADLLKNGNEAQATILKVWQTGLKVNINEQIGLRLQVQAPDSDPYETEIKAVVPKVLMDRYKEGRAVQVNVDPYDRTRVALAMPT
jgi:nitrogen fixation protein FixH